jgi:enamine deaminase RidA (YjgF/YER057c/UK114 family)
MNPYDQLKQLGLSLPAPVQPAAAFAMAVQTDNLLFLSGHIAMRDGKPWTGQLGKNVTLNDGNKAARAVGLDLLATLHSYLGDLSRVGRIVKLLCLVNSTADFSDQHLVANGCSELLNAVLGERGSHARSAIGVAQLPLGACVEIELIAELDRPG